MQTRTVALISLLTVSAISSANGLGLAGSYNLFVRGNATSSNSDTEGRVAVGGNASFTNYDIGLGQPGGDVLVVGGNLNFTNGTVRGNARHGGTFTGSGVSFLNGGAAIPGNPLDFTAAGNTLLNTSAAWGAITPTGSAIQQFSSLVLTGANADLNVFNITAAQLQGISEVNINVTAGSTVLINVAGGSVVFNNIGYNLNGNQTPANFQKVMWNAYQAGSISMSNLNGSLLAPSASLTTGFGAINGQLLVGEFSGNIQVNNVPFTGTVPEPGTMAALGLGALMTLRRRKRTA